MASPGPKRSQDIHVPPLTTSYPFPHTEPPSRNQSFSRTHARKSSTASSVSSLSAGVDGRNQLTESDPNAISTLLQPPIVRTGLQPHNASAASGYKTPNQRDIPPVTLTNIRHVEAKAFHPYLAQVGSLYEAFQRAKAEIDGGEASLFHREKKGKSEDWENVLNKSLKRPVRSRQNSEISPLASPTPTPRLSRRLTAQKKQMVTPLSTIPQVYSEEEFHLENPRTFDIVSERSEIIRDPNATPSGRKSLATNAILQEKLSWYMDTVEVHLISSISTASKSFFSALGELRELHAEAEDSVSRIQKLRRELARLDKEMAVDGLKVVNLRQRRDNVQRLAAAILQLQDIVLSIQKCDSEAKKGKLDGALDEIEQAELLMAGDLDSNHYKPQDFRKIRALDGALEDLNNLRTQVGRSYESRFHSTLLGDMRQHVANTEPLATLQRWGAAFTRPKPGQRRPQSTIASYVNMDPGFRSELESEMRGLSRAKFTMAAITTFRALVLREMKSMIRKQLPSSSDDDAMSTVSASTLGGGRRNQQEKSSMLARNLRALDDGDWYQMLVKIYTSISESLRRLSVQVKILLDVTSAMDQPQSTGLKSPPVAASEPDDAFSPRPGRPRSMSIQAEMQQALDLSNLLGDAVDAAYSQLTKVLKVRSSQIGDMSLEDFIRYISLNKLFANECEAISGRGGAGLKTVLDVQIKDFVSQFGNRQRHSMVEVLDADRWEAKDFGEQQTALLSRVVDSSTSDAASWVETTFIWQSSSATESANGNTANGTIPKVRSAEIDEQKFILSESPVAILRSIEQFQHLTIGVPTMGQEIVSSLLESLKLFNSRTSQLILGAGATRSAGLRNITTKHLALSSQGLSFIIALIPYIREFFRRYVPASSTGQNMTEFDKVRRLFQEHQNGIHEKLVDIMSNRAIAHIRVMKLVDWEKAAHDTTVKVSPFMEALVKETATLQRVLSKHLPEVDVMSIMVPVFDGYRKQWQTAFDEVELKSAAAKERLMADARLFEVKIGKLEGAGNLGSYIAGIVEAKPIKDLTADQAGPSSMSDVRKSTENRENKTGGERIDAQTNDAAAAPTPGTPTVATPDGVSKADPNDSAPAS